MSSERTAHVARAAAVARRRGCSEKDLRLLAGYVVDIADDDLLHRDPVDICGLVLAHQELARGRRPGQTAVRVFTPEVDCDGWTTEHTVVHIVTDDMPFLVDSTTNELSRAGRGIHLVAHPQLVVRRDAAGGFQEVVEATRGGHGPLSDVGEGLSVESWIHVEIDRSDSTEADAELAARLERVLVDVRLAVADWSVMVDRARAVAEQLDGHVPPRVDEAELSDAVRLLRWLADDHFTFLGYREYRLEDQPGDGGDQSGGGGDQPGGGEDAPSAGEPGRPRGAVLSSVPGSGLGILRQGDDTVRESVLSPAVAAHARRRDVLVLTKANSRSTVHRGGYLDYVGVKVFDADGRVVGEQRFLGLLSSAAYTQSVLSVPVIERKVAEVLRLSGFGRRTHSGKDLLTVLENYPRDELFAADVDTLTRISLAVLQLQERRRTRLFVRADEYGRFVSCLVYLPRDRYTTKVRLQMQAVLTDAYHAVAIEHAALVGESVLARLHFVVRLRPGAQPPQVDLQEVERRLVAVTRSWAEDLHDGLRAELGEAEAVRMTRRWADALPEAYKEDVTPRAAVGDLVRLERLESGSAAASDLDLLLYAPVGSKPGQYRLKMYRHDPLSLSEVLPYFDHVGVEVLDQRPYGLSGVGPRDPGPGPGSGRRSDGDEASHGEGASHGERPPAGETFWIYDFGLQLPMVAVARGTTTDPARLARRFTDALVAAWTEASESDGFDRLVLRAGLTWRQVVVLRTYARYLRQCGTTFSEDYIASVLSANPEVSRLLVAVFETRFDPDRFASGTSGGPSKARLGAGERAAQAVRAALDDVDSLAHDRILRSLLATIEATVRTSYYQLDGGGSPTPTVALKLDPARVPGLPDPRPAHEIWVCGPRVEGVHLRFGSVARGGLRWSDRREDFRTEILGLVKAQQVKNAVIVPTGAKGGFVGKRLPDPAKDREAWYAEGTACYRLFISALLDVTDNRNLSAGATPAPVVPPSRVVRHDADDSYLVVAADKGTAAFSDVANAISVRRGFWLGDAFASGGSKGYDHKAMGITARGAWESVRRHFSELDVDVDTDQFTVAGIGDMSGDVFGNGMLLSPGIRLVAAFDHRHVFVDPDPDPKASFTERERLLHLGRSSWDDYDRSLLSPGGGVHSRAAKRIDLPEEAARALGLGQQAVSLSPSELVRAVLLAPVDLLWNGGIGTYVKASTESNGEVGDKANDALRVDGRQLRCRVVGEGGNLGLTQRGRVEAALHGVLLSTDAIDNSAGVDCSDHEVNIKILLDRVVADGDLTSKQRDALLVDMTDDVADAVLRHNADQNMLLGLARHQAPTMLPAHRRQLRFLEQHADLDRALEFLPDDSALDERAERGLGLVGPELGVLVAYAKTHLATALAGSDLPDEPWTERYLLTYFPPQLRERYPQRIRSHPLRREIVATTLANLVLDTCGTTFAYRLGEELSVPADRVVRAWAVARAVFDQAAWRSGVRGLIGRLPMPTVNALLLTHRRLMDRAVRWLLQTRPDPLDVAAETDRFHDVVRALQPRLRGLLDEARHEQSGMDEGELVAAGATPPIAHRSVRMLDEFLLLDVAEIALRTGETPERVLEVYVTLLTRYEVDGVLQRITALPRLDRWQALARAALRYDLYAALEEMTTMVVRTSPDGTPLERIQTWESANEVVISRARRTLAEVRSISGHDLAPLSVALRTLRSVVKSGSADAAT